jgi:hypothetical protein
MKLTLITAAASITIGLLVLCSVARAQDAADKPAAPATPDAPASQPDAPGPAKFYGTIAAVDEKAKTITIDGQVYHIVGETQMAKASDGSTATIADAVVGDPARGSYTKASDGTMNITKVRFGKKTGGGKGGKTGGKKNSDAAATQPEK